IFLCFFTLVEVNYNLMQPQSSLAVFVGVGLVLCFLTFPLHKRLASVRALRWVDLDQREEAQKDAECRDDRTRDSFEPGGVLTGIGLAHKHSWGQAVSQSDPADSKQLSTVQRTARVT
ncbi:MAG: hypothetical protein AAFU85_23380, partial [Planctomycetota bacterium]